MVWHQATFFYESMWNLCLLILMLIVSRKPHKKGMLVCLYFTVYGLGRFLIERLRTDSLYIFSGLRVSQILYLILIVVGLLLWYFKIRKEELPKIQSPNPAGVVNGQDERATPAVDSSEECQNFLHFYYFFITHKQKLE